MPELSGTEGQPKGEKDPKDPKEGQWSIRNKSRKNDITLVYQ